MAKEKKDGKAIRAAFTKEVAEEAERMQHARREKQRSLWFGLGAMGMVGWSIAVPTLLGVLIGLWLDANWPKPFSWTLTLLITGLIIGCLGAWQWISQEQERIKRGGKKE